MRTVIPQSKGTVLVNWLRGDNFQISLYSFYVGWVWYRWASSIPGIQRCYMLYQLQKVNTQVVRNRIGASSQTTIWKRFWHFIDNEFHGVVSRLWETTYFLSFVIHKLCTKSNWKRNLFPCCIWTSCLLSSFHQEVTNTLFSTTFKFVDLLYLRVVLMKFVEKTSCIKFNWV